MSEEPNQAGRINWRTVVTVATFVALAILIYGLRKDIGNVIKNLGKVNTLALLLMVPFEAWNYDAYARDSRVGMLPPKLAQILINLATGQAEQKLESSDQRYRIRLLDPFCGTGVVLQEAMLMGYSVIGSDLEPRMVDYTQKNLQWLVGRHPQLENYADVEIGDATSYSWPRFSCVASEVFLGRPLAKLPAGDELHKIISDANTITKKFLNNIAPQLKPGQRLCLAVPAWRISGNKFKHLPVIDHLTDMGYNYLDLKHAERNDLLYYREDQIVARQIIILEKN